MQVVVPNKKIPLRVRQRRIHKDNLVVAMEIDSRAVPLNLSLTPKAIARNKTTGNLAGYSTFEGLDTADILSILSAARRGEVYLGPDRFRRVATYRLRS